MLRAELFVDHAVLLGCRVRLPFEDLDLAVGLLDLLALVSEHPVFLRERHASLDLVRLQHPEQRTGLVLIGLEGNEGLVVAGRRVVQSSPS